MDGSDDQAVVFSSKKRHGFKFPKIKKRNRKIYIIGCSIIIFGLVAYLLSINFSNGSPQDRQCNGKANSPIYSRASTFLNPSAQTSLQPVADSISTMKNYQKDPSCLYVLTINYLNKGDAANTSKYYVLLSKVYNPKKGLVKSLGNKLVPYQTLTYQVEYLQKLSAQYKKSIEVNTFKQPK
jgi:hypothetical protein